LLREISEAKIYLRNLYTTNSEVKELSQESVHGDAPADFSTHIATGSEKAEGSSAAAEDLIHSSDDVAAGAGHDAYIASGAEKNDGFSAMAEDPTQTSGDVAAGVEKTQNFPATGQDVLAVDSDEFYIKRVDVETVGNASPAAVHMTQGRLSRQHPLAVLRSLKASFF
jgi:hypothetical protein